MTDLDTLRQALQVPEEAADPLDIPAIVSRGRRLRTRRRLVALGGGLCAAAVVFGAVTGITRLVAPSTGPTVPVGPGPTAPAPHRSHAAPRPTGGAATPSPAPSGATNSTTTNPVASPTFPAGGPSPTFSGTGPTPTFSHSVPTPSPSATGQLGSAPASPSP